MISSISSTCKLYESFKAPEAMAYLQKQTINETPVSHWKGQYPPTSSIKRGRHMDAKRHGQQRDETHEAK